MNDNSHRLCYNLEGVFDAEKERKRLQGGRFGCCEEKSKAYRVDGISPRLCHRPIQCSFLDLHSHIVRFRSGPVPCYLHVLNAMK